MKTIKAFFDCEFTGLHKDTTIVSIGIVTERFGENGASKMFYAEFTDYDKNQIDDWLEENVINNLCLDKINEDKEVVSYIDRFIEAKDKEDLDRLICVRGDKKVIRRELEKWFNCFEDATIKLWSDCLHYDFVLFNDIFGSPFNLPKNVYYIPFDICTLFEMLNIDPDITREKFVDTEDIFINIDGFEINKKHNSLFDAMVIRECHDKLIITLEGH